MPKTNERPQPTARFAGANVIAKIDGKEVGPIYCVQVVDGIATLQAGETYEVPVTDVKPC